MEWVQSAKADQLVEDLLTMPENSIFSIRSQRFSFNARVLHAERWQSAEGQISVVVKLETVGAPKYLEPPTEPVDSVWKP